MKKNKLILLFFGILGCGLFVLTGSFFRQKRLNYSLNSTTVTSAVVKIIDNEILADGMVRSNNEVSLHFQVGGKVVYLPVKEGDYVKQGQIIASLDSYTLQKQLQAALNNYRINRHSFDQINENAQDNVLKAQQTLPYDYFSKAGMDLSNKESAYNNVVKRLIDQSQANLDNSVIQVEIANYALTYSNLTSPFDGVIIHQDITTPNVIISPQHTFVIIDPKALIVKANIAESDIDCIQEGAAVTIQLNGLRDKKITGLVTKIYPDKVILPTGESVYPIDIESEELNRIAKYRQTTTVMIKNKYHHSVVLIPSWLVLAQQYVWVLDHNQPVMKKVVVGEVVGNNIQIISGLNQDDKLITDPTKVIRDKYHLL